MKIGFLAERLIQGYGVDLVMHNQANGLADLGHDVTIYVQRYDKTFKNQKYQVIEIDSPLYFNPLKTEFLLLKRKIAFFRNQDNDAWIIQTWPMNVLTPFLKGKKFILDHGTVSTQGMYFKQKLVFWYQKYVSQFVYFPFATRIFSISKYIRSLLPFFLRWKTDIVYNGADHYTKDYQSNTKDVTALKKKLGIGSKDVTMLYVGRLNAGRNPYKGVDDLLQIYKKASNMLSEQSRPTLKLIMAGFGTKEDQKELAKLGIIALTNVPQKELLQLFETCDFYVSASKWEGFNLPMIEAQSFGKLPIIYNIGPHSEIISNGENGFLVESQGEFIKKVVFLTREKEFRELHKEKAIENSLKFTWAKNVEKLNSILTKYTS